MMQSLRIGSYIISTYPMMIAVGAIGMLVCIWKRRSVFSLNRLQCILFTIMLTLCGIAGARLLFILENLDSLESALSGNGVSFFGSVYLIPLVMPFIGKLLRLRAGQVHDLCAPCVAIMVGFIRIGCYMNDCCGGWVMYLGKYYFTWPTQIMECIGDFAISFWLLQLEKQEKYQGLLYPLLMISYSVLRFFVEFFRYSPNKWYGFSAGHGFALIAIIVASLWLICHRRCKGTGDKYE